MIAELITSITNLLAGVGYIFVGVVVIAFVVAILRSLK